MLNMKEFWRQMNEMRRQAIYVYHDPDGILREHASIYLEGLKEVASDVLLVANGDLLEESRQKLGKMGLRAGLCVKMKDGTFRHGERGWRIAAGGIACRVLMS